VFEVAEGIFSIEENQRIARMKALYRVRGRTPGGFAAAFGRIVSIWRNVEDAPVRDGRIRRGRGGNGNRRDDRIGC
jgi:hypothetical protein